MLTKVTIRNFKRFGEVEVELGNVVVLIGPNNSGKTTALQALALWHVGLQRWLDRRGGKDTPEMRPGVTINRRDLIAIPVPDANLLWRDRHTRDVMRGSNGKPQTKNIRADVIVEGVTAEIQWKCGLEFDYANSESFYCRPLRETEDGKHRMKIPEQAGRVQVAFLPPMSGLAASETQLTPGAISVRLGEGRTAEVLRNLCYMISQDKDGRGSWSDLSACMGRLFGVTLEEPEYVVERGEITMGYRERDRLFDLSSSGRGLQQTLLLLAYLHANPGAVLLLDEPDAHLEILRQRQIYETISTTASKLGCQVVAASHSEVILNEAADRDVVVAFVGTPHRVDDRSSQHQLLKSLKEIGFEQYLQADQTGWVLYLEGSTDLAILQALAHTLQHPAEKLLERPFVHYVGNIPSKADSHFRALKEAKPDLVGLAIYDRLGRELEDRPDLLQCMWERREIENYLATPEVLQRWARETVPGDDGSLFTAPDRQHREQVMEQCIRDRVPPAAYRDRGDRWWADTKISDEFLDPVFEAFYQELGLPDLVRKTDYHVLAKHVLKEEVAPEVTSVLDRIVQVAGRAAPATEEGEGGG